MREVKRICPAGDGLLQNAILPQPVEAHGRWYDQLVQPERADCRRGGGCVPADQQMRVGTAGPAAAPVVGAVGDRLGDVLVQGTVEVFGTQTTLGQVHLVQQQCADLVSRQRVDPGQGDDQAQGRILQQTSALHASAEQAESFVRTAYAISDAANSRALPREESE
ncbi:hypothetical protein [Streptomyces sp. NPDC093990]|uniref:hypothetical protein n=1 Tax=Streptomyces sp. NPDC093990 TaxID=3155306 RepID=UPI00341ADE69